MSIKAYSFLNIHFKNIISFILYINWSYVNISLEKISKPKSMSLKNSCKRIIVTVESTCLFTLTTTQFTYGVVQSVEFCISPEHKPLMPSNTDNYFVNLTRQGLRQSHIRCYNLASQSSQNVDKSIRGHSQYSVSSCLSAHWSRECWHWGSLVAPPSWDLSESHKQQLIDATGPQMASLPLWHTWFWLEHSILVLRKTQMH